MSKNYDTFRSLLQEMFQLDQADLDFGIYRIMNQKRDEIIRFLDEDLLPQVKETLTELTTDENKHLKGELEEAIASAKTLGADPDSLPKVQELKNKLKAGPNVTALEHEVFSDLVTFFRRYYHEGDFLSLRRYKEGVYAIPYEGEEVKLHWANHDQYYIKSSENFKDYTFKLPSGKRAHFKLVEADTEVDNRKVQEGKERRFILASEEPVVEEEGDLFIRFEYRPDGGKAKQAELNKKAIEAVLSESIVTKDWQELATPKPTDTNKRRTLLEWRIDEYTKSNKFDFFIHKDLGGFLNRELDFFIKNEVMHLDDIEDASVTKVEQYLAKLKAIRRIAHKIINFLSQLENFQKKLWLKKKFVVESNYYITLDRISEDFYAEISENDAQREEWVTLFAIDEIKANEGDFVDKAQPMYSIPLTPRFLKVNRNLVLDTQFFGECFKERLLASIDNIDDKCDGLMIHSENYQALNLMQNRYCEQVKCIYVDPPYNLGPRDFMYKDNYQSSSWATLISESASKSLRFLRDDSCYFFFYWIA